MRASYIALAASVLAVFLTLVTVVVNQPQPNQPQPTIIPILLRGSACGELAVQVENHAGAALLYALYLGPPGRGVEDAFLLDVRGPNGSLPSLAPGTQVLHRFPVPCGEFLVWAWLSGRYKSEETIIEEGKTSPVRFVFP